MGQGKIKPIRRISFPSVAFDEWESEQFLEVLIYPKSVKDVDEIISNSMGAIHGLVEAELGKYKIKDVDEKNFYNAFKIFGDNEIVGKIKKTLNKSNCGNINTAYIVEFEDKTMIEVVGVIFTDNNSVFVNWYSTA